MKKKKADTSNTLLMEDGEMIFGVTKAAEYCSVHPQTIKKNMKRGRLTPDVKLTESSGRARMLGFSTRTLDAFLDILTDPTHKGRPIQAQKARQQA